MIKNFVIFSYYDSKLKKIYSENLRRFGFTPGGVFWNSKTSQYLRFDKLIKLIKQNKKKKKLRIADIGCGYGELLNFFKSNSVNNILYSGYDINPDLINYCKKRFPKNFFYVKNCPIEKCDFSVITGTYNFATTNNIEKWESYIIYNLEKCYRASSQGLIFNLQFSRESRIKNNIYYTNVDNMKNILSKKFKCVSSFFDKRMPNDVFFVVLKN
mgnify:CR=1 FL=1